MSLSIKISEDVARLLSRSLVKEFKIFPLEFLLPQFSELWFISGNNLSSEDIMKYHDNRSYIKFFCVNELDKEQIKNLHAIFGFTSFEFVGPKHPEYNKYIDIKNNFDSYVQRYYPNENME